MSLASPSATKAALAVAAFAVAYKATSRYLAASDEDGHADGEALAEAERARDAADKRAEEAEARSSSLEVVAANCAAFRAAADSARREAERDLLETRREAGTALRRATDKISKLRAESKQRRIQCSAAIAVCEALREEKTAAEATVAATNSRLATVPDDILRTHILQLWALEKENGYLQGEVGRLRRLLTIPYFRGAVALIAQHSAEGYAGLDLDGRAAADAYAEALELEDVTLGDYLRAQFKQLSHADKAAIIPDLIARGFCVTKNDVDDDCDALSIAFTYQWSETMHFDEAPVPRRFQYQNDSVSYSPPRPRFPVGTEVECALGEGEEGWVPCEVVQIGWGETFGDMGPVPDGGYDYICPYQVRTDSGRLAMAPYDTDEFIRLRRNLLLQAVKDAGVSDDKLLDTALKAVDKLADAFEVTDGNIDDCF